VDGCDICDVLLPDCEPGMTAHFSPKQLHADSIWHSSMVEESDSGAVLLKVYVTGNTIASSDYIFFTPSEYLETGPGFLQLRTVQRAVDYDQAHAWLENCRKHHGPDCNQPTPPIIDGLRLYDCLTAKVVLAKSVANPPWLALSYVWGETAHFKPIEVSDDHRVTDLPRTIHDAVIVTKQLGYRYLWIDELCIDQRNIVHKDSQLKQMDRIYRDADLTIVAAAGDNKAYGIPGVSTRNRSTHPILRFDQGVLLSIGPEPNRQVALNSTWSTRAWTFQEGILPRRLLVFTDTQMTFYCQRASWMESLGGPQYMQRQDIDWDNWPIRPSIRDPFDNKRNTGLVKASSTREFLDLMQDYTGRELSYETDALKAVSGVLRRLKDSNRPTFSLSGLPFNLDGKYSTEKVAISQPGNVLGLALAWLHRPEVKDPERRSMFPSWSWAGWKGSVYWMCNPSLTSDTGHTSHVQSYQMLNAAGEYVQPHTNDAQLQEKLDLVTVLVLEALIIPPGLIRMEALEQSEFKGAKEYVQYETMVVNHPLRRFDVFPESLFDRLVVNVRSGLWSCFSLLKQSTPRRITAFFILIVQWVNEDTATRVGCFQLLRQHMPKDETPFESLLETRKFKLI
jgi:hypothetical protein